MVGTEPFSLNARNFPAPVGAPTGIVLPLSVGLFATSPDGLDGLEIEAEPAEFLVVESTVEAVQPFGRHEIEILGA